MVDREIELIKSKKVEGLVQIFSKAHYDFRGEYWPLFEEGRIEGYLSKQDAFEWKQDGISTARRNVLRGFHGDAKTTKLVTCLHGEVYSVIIDMRVDSPTYLSWDSFVLNPGLRNQLLIPPGCGNSYLALTDDVIYMYKQNTHYGDQPQFTVRWDDPTFSSIPWPVKSPILSERDANAADLLSRGVDPYLQTR